MKKNTFLQLNTHLFTNKKEIENSLIIFNRLEQASELVEGGISS